MGLQERKRCERIMVPVSHASCKSLIYDCFELTCNGPYPPLCITFSLCSQLEHLLFYSCIIFEILLSRQFVASIPKRHGGHLDFSGTQSSNRL